MLLSSDLPALAKALIVLGGALTLSWTTTSAVGRIPVWARLLLASRPEWA
jgi:hypothetical protein